MSVKKFILSIASLFLIASIFFAPLPWSIALNHETKECAGYWGGDEFVTYEIPSGWKEFEFQYSEDFIVAETDIGTCQVAKDGISADLEKTCCSQLGYTYVSENIGIRRITSFNLTSQAEMEKYANQDSQATSTENYIIIFAGLALMTTLTILLVKENKKK